MCWGWGLLCALRLGNLPRILIWAKGDTLRAQWQHYYFHWYLRITISYNHCYSHSHTKNKEIPQQSLSPELDTLTYTPKCPSTGQALQCWVSSGTDGPLCSKNHPVGFGRGSGQCRFPQCHFSFLPAPPSLIPFHLPSQSLDLQNLVALILASISTSQNLAWHTEKEKQAFWKASALGRKRIDSGAWLFPRPESVLPLDAWCLTTGSLSCQPSPGMVLPIGVWLGSLVGQGKVAFREGLHWPGRANRSQWWLGWKKPSQLVLSVLVFPDLHSIVSETIADIYHSQSKPGITMVTVQSQAQHGYGKERRKQKSVIHFL